MGESAYWPFDVVVGYHAFTTTTAATTIITIPAGEIWQGYIAMMCSVAEAAAGTVAPVASVTVATAGSGVTPAAGTVASCVAQGGANAAGGTVGEAGNNSLVVPMTIIAPGANLVTVTATTFVAGTSGNITVTCSGVLIASWQGR